MAPTPAPPTAASPEAKAALDLVNELVRQLLRRNVEADRYDSYYRGQHPLAFASPAWKSYWGSLFDSFADNWCPLVVNSTTERLAVTGIRLGENTAGALSARAVADTESWRVWQENDLDGESGQAFLDALIAGRSYVLVWGNPDDESTPEVTFEHATQMIVVYEPGSRRRKLAALKRWCDDKTEFATLYKPDWVWKWQRAKPSVLLEQSQTPSGLYVPVPLDLGQSTWEPRQPAGDRTWPLRNPMGVVPAEELPVKPRLVAPPESELAGVTPLQDYINLLWSHLATASDFVAMPQRVVLGAQRPKRPIFNDAGVKVGEEDIPLERFAIDKVVWITGENAKVAQWPQADLDVYTKVIDQITGHIAAETRTPQHYLVGKMANLSADALRAAEAGLVSKARERQLYFGAALRRMWRLVALAQGDAAKAKALATAEVLWRDAETRSQSQLVDELVKLASIGVPDEVLWEIYGFTPPQIARFRGLMDAQAVRQGAADMALFGTKPGAGAVPGQPSAA